MSGYLDYFSTTEARRERREKIIKRVSVALVILVILGGVLYLKFRNYQEEQRVKTFLQLLENKDYEAAYVLWGCTEAKPCPGYSFEKFLADWGPEGVHPTVSAARITRTRSCKEGIIQTLSFPQGDEVWLWVSRSDKTIGYSPWPGCHPRLPKSVFQQQ